MRLNLPACFTWVLWKIKSRLFSPIPIPPFLWFLKYNSHQQTFSKDSATPLLSLPSPLHPGVSTFTRCSNHPSNTSLGQRCLSVRSTWPLLAPIFILPWAGQQEGEGFISNPVSGLFYRVNPGTCNLLLIKAKSSKHGTTVPSTKTWLNSRNLIVYTV